MLCERRLKISSKKSLAVWPENLPRVYFAYGSNLDTEQMSYRCQTAKPLCRAVLPDYRLVFRNFADVEPSVGKTVEGALYCLELQDLAALDRYEGFPRLYYREIVRVRSGSTVLRAFCYRMTSRDYAIPSREYLSIIKQGYRDWGIPERHLANIPTRPVSAVNLWWQNF